MPATNASIQLLDLASAKPPPPVLDPTRATVLIVDDEEGPRQSLRVIFKDTYNLLLASDGDSALQLARQFQIDVAILDIRMEGMSGVELLGYLKDLDPGMEIIMLTAYETIETIRQALRLGARDYLNKPFDISTMRAAVENAMERRNLYRAIQGNNHKLEELQDQLQNQKLQEEIVKSRGDIYASIIHDINGPLTIISGFISLINRRIADTQQIEGESLDLVKDRLNRITRQVTNCIDISRRYLSFLRQEPGEPTRVGINQILSDLEELLKVHPSVRGNELLIHSLPDDVSVEIYGTDLIQVLLNLAINALQATDEAHMVEITGELHQGEFDLSKVQDSENERYMNQEDFLNGNLVLALSVRDDGPGISPEAMAKVFDPYYSTKKESGKGTGLGLTIVKRLIGESKGLLRLHSKVGEGTTFTIYLRACHMTR